MSYNVCKPGGAPFASWFSRFLVRQDLASAFLRFLLTVRGRFVAGVVFSLLPAQNGVSAPFRIGMEFRFAP